MKVIKFLHKCMTVIVLYLIVIIVVYKNDKANRVYKMKKVDLIFFLSFIMPFIREPPNDVV